MNKVTNTPEKVLSNLVAARAMIEDVGHWATGSMARTALHRPVAVFSEQACRFCSLGALVKADRALYSADECTEEDLLKQAAQELGFSQVTVANDTGGHNVALEMYRLAINRAKWLKAEAEGLVTAPEVKAPAKVLIEALPFIGLR